ncbi:MAG: hypothetical protein NC932_01880 [Candidatus Omnitrophica bacterium]|nr:hypothetical protein [Candidatus Omnitrophota bacterium]
MLFPDTKSYKYIERHTAYVIKKCRRKVSVPYFPRNNVFVYIPGGDEKYPSFWIRDAVMQCRSGFIPFDEMKTMLGIILFFQNGQEYRKLANNLCITPWAIPDHINLYGLGTEEFQKTYPSGPVFYPGTYSASDNQGDGSYGIRPPDDNIYEVIQLAYLLISLSEVSDAAKLLNISINGVSVIERLHFGFQSASVDKETGLHWNTPQNWAASNFHDALRPMGAIALTSLLRFRAARQMAELFRIMDENEKEEIYLQIAENLKKNIQKTFQRDDGWLICATKVNCQPDTWSTGMACYYGLLQGDYFTSACEALLKSCSTGSLSVNGYLRHTPVWADCIPGKVVWEDRKMDYDRSYGIYQNGGYWPQPIGYVCWSIAQIDRKYATRIAIEFIEHTRKFEEEGAPFEWINPYVLKERPGDGRWYGASISLPLEGFRRLSS